MSIARMTQDGIEVAAHLCTRLRQKSIVLCALSWGSVLALGMLTRRSDLFAAYVGTGQIVDMPAGERFAYENVLAQAKSRLKRPAIAALEWIGPPPFGGGKARRIWQQWLLDFAPASERRAMREMPLLLLSAPRTRLRDVWHTLAGVIFSYAHLFEPLTAFRAEPYGTRFDVPMFFFQGSDDLQTPTRLVSDYAARICAPVKDIVLLEGGGHMVIRTMGEKFLEELIMRVRPVAIFPLESKAPLAGPAGRSYSI
jgi:pimeloyl-ACP methyl ester carboxylesterase